MEITKDDLRYSVVKEISILCILLTLFAPYKFSGVLLLICGLIYIIKNFSIKRYLIYFLISLPFVLVHFLSSPMIVYFIPIAFLSLYLINLFFVLYITFSKKYESKQKIILWIFFSASFAIIFIHLFIYIILNLDKIKSPW